MMGCDISRGKIEACIQIAPDSKNRRVLKHGEYAGKAFATWEQWRAAGDVIENGVLPQILTIPWFRIAYAPEEELKDPEMADQKRKFDETVKQDLLFKNPAGILKLMEINSDKEVMFQFEHDP